MIFSFENQRKRGRALMFKFESILRYKKRQAVSALTVILAVALTAAAQNKPAIFIADKGKFTIQLDGQTVAYENFEIARSPNGGWVAKGTTELKVPHTTPSTVTGTLTMRPDGTPITYDWTAQAEKTNAANIVFANGIAKVTLQMQGARPFQQDMSFGTPLVAILDNNLYHQYAVLARLYDWSKRGAQTFPVIIPQELTPGSITVEATGEASAVGKSYEGLRATTSDLQVLLFLDKEHRLQRLEVPSAKVVITRE
jgi:hypothetical protein